MSESALFKAAEAYAEAAFDDGGRTIRHLRNTATHVVELMPAADEALLIAAVTHDIERSSAQPNPYAGGSFRDPRFLNHHQEEGARMMAEFLETQGAPLSLIDKVRSLISKHEVGGSPEADVLRDADSMSFFADNLEDFFEGKFANQSRGDVAEKVRWMFERVDSPVAKAFCKPYFDQAMDRLS